LLVELGLIALSGGNSGTLNGTRKRDKEREPRLGSPVRASASATLLSVALENHLKPLSVYLEPGEEGGVV
jgi:hypothetical protein